MSLLIACPEEGRAQQLAQRLHAAGWRIAGALSCGNLVREAVRLAPEAVVVEADGAEPGLFDALLLLQAARALPVLLCSARLGEAQAARAAEAGVLQCLPAPCEPDALRPALSLARALFTQRQALRRELDGAQSRLEERKWIDRAKGRLMSAQQLSEQDAFALLRTASMQANLRVGEVSRAVIEAAEAAEAVNRAGQLRMLSQRIVKALALDLAGVERGAAADWLQDSMSRIQANIDQLAAHELQDSLHPLRAGALAAWQQLQSRMALNGPADLAMLAAVDADAQRLLDDAQRFTDGLQAASGRRNLQIVNLSGRQRMLSQRLAKQALLAGLLPAAEGQAQAVAALASVADFDAALGQLERAPLTSEEIRELLAIARGQWQRMLGAVRDSSARDNRVLLARESEALLTSFERLTSLYERSIQMLMG